MIMVLGRLKMGGGSVGNRKNGHIFINGRTGKRLTLRHFEKMIDKLGPAAEHPEMSVHQFKFFFIFNCLVLIIPEYKLSFRIHS